MTNAKRVWLMAVVLSLSASPVLGYINLTGGATYDIDYEINDDIWVDYQATTAMRTRVNLLDGGSIGWLNAYENGRINISGGSIGVLQANYYSQVDISGGSIGQSLYAQHRGQVDISGGSIGAELFAEDWAILTVHGSDFAVDGAPFGYGELTSILGGHVWLEPYRHLTGTLASGEPINNGFYIGHNAKIALVPAPGALVLGSIGLGFIGWLRRRRTL